MLFNNYLRQLSLQFFAQPATFRFRQWVVVMGLALAPMAVRCQVTIAGPTCVVPGTIYQYILSGPWDSTSLMQVCLSGGTINSTGNSCTPQVTPYSSLLVTWTAAGSASVQLNSSKGNVTLPVTVINPLNAGTVAVSLRSQIIAYKSKPLAITCTDPSGGSCSPKYQYQWQASINRLEWTNVPGAIGTQLILVQPLLQQTFFRRKVTETASGTIAYSDEAAVDVKAPDPAVLITN